MFDKIKKKIEIVINKAFIDGMDLSWECARKIYCDITKGELIEIFGTNKSGEILRNLSASEAMDKIKEYEEKERCKECKYPLMNPLCGVGNETCNRKQEYEEKHNKTCDTCEHFYNDFGCAYKCDKNMSEWSPKQIEKDCTTCKHEDETDSGECYECIKDIQNHYEQKQDDEITIDQAIDNIKRGYGIPYKHKTIALAVEALKMMKEKSPIEQAYADVERQI